MSKNPPSASYKRPLYARPELWDRYVAVAKKLDRNVSWVIRHVLEDKIESLEAAAEKYDREHGARGE